MTRTLVVTSTFPQWDSDPRGAFLRRFWEARARQDERVEVLAPRTAWCRGRLDTPLHVMRFAYAPAVCSTLSGEHGILENVRARPWRIVLVPAFFAGMAAAVARRLAAGRCDRVVAHMMIPSGIVVAALCRRAGVPFEIYGHGTDVDVLVAAPGVVRRLVARRFAAAAAIHVPSRDKLRRLCTALPALADRCRVATMAETVLAVPGERRPVAGRIVFLGRLIRQKGVAELVDAVARLGPAASLVVAGDGPERARLMAQAARAGIDAIFLGFVEGPAKHALLASAAVVCVPSREVGCLSEGTPLVVLEARAQRVPVVATRVGGIPELAAGDEGVRLVAPGDPRALAVALRQQLAMPVHVAMHRVAEGECAPGAPDHRLFSD
jgi:glycosyltransferase involved in cell wall biosynthesis